MRASGQAKRTRSSLGLENNDNGGKKSKSLLQTASGKGVVITEEARRKSMSILEKGSSSSSSSSSGGAALAVSAPRKSLLQTASGKGVVITEEARRKSTQRMNKPDGDEAQAAGKQNGDGQGQEKHEVERRESRLSVSQIEAEMEAIAELDESLIFTQPVATSQESAQFKADAMPDQTTGGLYESVQSLPDHMAAYDMQAEVDKREKSHLKRFQLLLQISSSQALRLRVPQIGSIQLGEGQGQSIAEYVENYLDSLGYAHTPAAMKRACRKPEHVLVRRTWLQMQTRWVVWRLAILEMADPQQYLGALLTGQNIARAVQYRLLVYVNDRDELSANFSSLLEISGAHRHFSALNSNRMSPLQRCADIMALVWPLVLCICVSKRPNFESTGAADYMVSDGWWWSPAHLDPGLQALVKRGRLKDGDKICIFTAGFPKASGPQAVSLELNGVRPADRHARYGYISPRYLTRGLTLASVTAHGGGIYAVNVTIILITSTMCKVKRPFLTTMNETENRCFRTELEHLQSNAEASLENHEDLSARSVLESLSLDDAHWALEVIRTVEEGGHVNDLTESQERALPGIYERLRAQRLYLKEQLMRELVNDLEISQSGYRDALIRCNFSGALGWLRIAQDPSGRADADGGDVADWPLNQAVLISNLKPLWSRNSQVLLQLGSQSTVQPLATTEGHSVTVAAPVQGQLPAPMHNPLTQHGSQRALLSSLSKLGPRVVGEEVCFEGTVLEWSETDATPLDPAQGQAKQSMVRRLREVEIVLTDASRVLCVVKYLVPVLAKKSLRWLVKDARVKVLFAVIQHMDTPQEILLLGRGDRTSVTPIVSPSSSSLKGDQRRQSTGAVKPRTGANSKLRRNQTQVASRRKTMGAISDGADFNHYPSMAADAKSTAGDMALAAMQLRVAEEETRRWHAIKASEKHFTCVLPLTRRESCVRSPRHHAILALASTVEVQAAGRQPEPEGLTMVRVTSNEGRLIELMCVATSVLEKSHRKRDVPVETNAEKERLKDVDQGENLLMRLRSGGSAHVHLVVSSHYDMTDSGAKIVGSSVVHLEELGTLGGTVLS